jgi:predicted TIM-barrel enzyme
MIAIIKVSIFAALMTGFIIGTSIKEKRSKKAKIEKIIK